MSETIGTCSLCGGRVTRPGAVGTLTCQQCGATAENSYGPLIPMKQPDIEWSAGLGEVSRQVYITQT